MKLIYTGKESRPVMGFDKVVLNNVHYKKVPGIQPLYYADSTKMKIINSGTIADMSIK